MRPINYCIMSTVSRGNYRPAIRVSLFSFALLCLLSATQTTDVRPVPAKVKAESVNAGEQENLKVLHQWLRWNDPGSLLIHHLTRQAVDLHDIRNREVAKLKTTGEWIERQAKVKEILNDIVGPFPGKTPLNPLVTGTIIKEDFSAEKIIYEAMPGYYVPGTVFIPNGIKGQAPAVLYVSGHDQESFRARLYQVVILNLVKRGIIVLAIDPPGQGEHVQYFDPAINFSTVGYSVIEHNYFGNQCFLSGSSSAKYFIWEGIRGIDYLLSRHDVDPERIGVTGFSGGGTITAYISAFDERVKVSVPCSWSTWNKSLLETKGIQDAESFLFHGLARGISFEDLLEVRAPKPALLTFVSRDQYLSLQGARDAFLEAKRAYSAFGGQDNLEMIEDDYRHWMTPRIRETIYAFFMKHFNLTGDLAEEAVEIMTAEELQVTPTGQVSTSFGGDMIFDVNRQETEKLIRNLERSRKDIESHLKLVRAGAKKLSGFVPPREGNNEPFINGKYRREGYSVAKYTVAGEGDYPVPLLLFVPDEMTGNHPAIIYLHSDGKEAGSQPGGEIEKLVKRGYVVAAVDLPGVGELKNSAVRKSQEGYIALLTGRSIVGIQAADIIRVAGFLKSLPGVESCRIGAIGYNGMCIPLMHAAAFDRSVKNVLLVDSPLSYRSIAMNRIYRIGLTKTRQGGTHHPYEVDFSWAVGGALTSYDLPDLIGCIAPGKVLLAGMRNHLQEEASVEIIQQELSFPVSVYSRKGCPGNIKIALSKDDPLDFADWCFR